MNNQLIDPCQPPNLWVDFHTRKRCEDYLLKMHRRLDKAVRDNNIDRIRHITHLLSIRSEAVKIVAIERVTRQNQGKHTAGVDGVKTPKDREEADHFRRHLLEKVDIRNRPSPIRRVFIPKPNGKTRPLGIPTIENRVAQDIIRLTIEPIAEYHFLDCSYGFRPKRGCQDAIEHIFSKLAHRRCSQWIIEGDIKGCFDSISHSTIIQTMEAWKIPKSIQVVVRRLLKAGILTNEDKVLNRTGTPQGGILSPMLANMALTALDEWGASQKGANPIVRYADDFIATARTFDEAQRMVYEIRRLLKEKIGVELSDEKTRITNIHDGIDFLGFNIRKYRHKSPYSKYHAIGQLLIKPQPQKVTQFLKESRQLIKEYRGKNLHQLLMVLNPKLNGFANYYRFVVSQETYQKISDAIWRKVYKWLRQSHPKKSTKWVMNRYLSEYSKIHTTRTFEMNRVKLYLPKFMPIVRFKKVKSGIRVYDNSSTARAYWEKRKYANALYCIYSIRVEKLFKRQIGQCPICRKGISSVQIRQSEIHTHHLNPKSKSDDHRLTNLRLIHDDCHRQLHRILSTDEMSKLAQQQIDYCNKDYLYHMLV